MKKTVFALATALVLGSTAAYAGGLAEPRIEPVVTAPVVALNWTGFYAGGQVAHAEGDATLGKNSVSGNDTLYGIFAGYRHQLNNDLVLGAELDYKNSDDFDATALKAQVGYAVGNFLPYATVGYAEVKVAGVNDQAPVYGVGVDYRVNERFTVGAEYLHIEADDAFGVTGLNAKADTVALRAAFRF